MQYTTPVVIMTSDAKKNHALVRGLLQSFNWFGRGEENFRYPLFPAFHLGVHVLLFDPFALAANSHASAAETMARKGQNSES